ncbi:unnamed protein product [Protopolystoma xenopodis]|uniref:Uncharacterized protein n=1 Tax=Protopolystoma xenopodis TaxID=117903 RepID=A0A3S5FGT3_9PLAT|nr:unnamed protein product [Protopolystoma xenopodis]
MVLRCSDAGNNEYYDEGHRNRCLRSRRSTGPSKHTRSTSEHPRVCEESKLPTASIIYRRNDNGLTSKALVDEIDMLPRTHSDFAPSTKSSVSSAQARQPNPSWDLDTKATGIQSDPSLDRAGWAMAWQCRAMAEFDHQLSDADCSRCKCIPNQPTETSLLNYRPREEASLSGARAKSCEAPNNNFNKTSAKV